jgi:hypothetical protein
MGILASLSRDKQDPGPTGSIDGAGDEWVSSPCESGVSVLETWRVQSQRVLRPDWGLGAVAEASMTWSAALGILVVGRTMRGLTAFDLDLGVPDGRDILRGHFRYHTDKYEYNPQMHVQFLEGDPSNLLAVAWSGLGRSQLQLVDVVRERVVATLCTGPHVNDEMALAVTKDLIALEVAFTDAPYGMVLGEPTVILFRQHGGCWAEEARIPRRIHTCGSYRGVSLTFAVRSARPCVEDLLELQSYYDGGVCLTSFVASAEGTLPVTRRVTKDLDHCQWTWVRSSSPGVLLAKSGCSTKLVALRPRELDAEGRVPATVVHTFRNGRRNDIVAATYVAGHGLLVLCDEHHAVERHGVILYTLVGPAMSAARDAWMRACVRRRARAR